MYIYIYTCIHNIVSPLLIVAIWTKIDCQGLFLKRRETKIHTNSFTCFICFAASGLWGGGGGCSGQIMNNGMRSGFSETGP